MRIFISLIVFVIVYSNYRRKMLLSSSSVWVICYFMIFVLYPLYGTENVANNADLIDLYATIGILMFAIGYIIAQAKKTKRRSSVSEIQIGFQRVPKFWVAFPFFVVIAFLTIQQFLIKYGAGAILLILSGAVTSKTLVNEFNGEIGGLYDICLQLLIPFALAVWVTARTKKEFVIKIICAVVFISIQVLFNFTRIYLITFVAVLLFYELRHAATKRQAVVMGIGASLLTVVMISMNFIRTFGLGDTPDYDSYVNLEYVFESTDFGFSYYWFDRLLDYGYPGISPLAWLKFLFVFIPRSVWPSKPEQISMQILKKIDPSMQATGYSTAGNSILGEGFAIFGVIGIFLLPFIWGYVCTRLDNNYYQRIKSGEDNSVSMILYYLFSIFIILSAQRGDWSQYMTIFIYWWTIPLLFISKKEKFLYLVNRPSK